MILVGLTGGIGAGKSTVSARLAERGAVIIDADAIAREVQQPGSPVLAAMAERFGDGVIAADGSLDRGAVAAIVFSDPEALGDLNRIVHPAIGREVNRRIEEQLAADHVVVLDIPLLAENPRAGLAATIVVDVPVDTAVDRLVRSRGMDEADARARIGHQATREERLAGADRVIDNSGPPGALDAQVDELWAWLQKLPPVPPDFQPTAPPTA
ncbi:MAG: dephospho-CoA kinase [Acidimicrobiia bacterium]